jgi:hypothetical protein
LREELETAQAELLEERQRCEEKDQEMESLRQQLAETEASLQSEMDHAGRCISEEESQAHRHRLHEEGQQEQHEEIHSQLQLNFAEARAEYDQKAEEWVAERTTLHEELHPLRDQHALTSEALEHAQRSLKTELAEANARHQHRLVRVSQDSKKAEIRLKEEVAALQAELAAHTRRRSKGMSRRLRAQLEGEDPMSYENPSPNSSLPISNRGSVDEGTLRGLISESHSTLEAVREVLGLDRREIGRFPLRRQVDEPPRWGVAPERVPLPVVDISTI